MILKLKNILTITLITVSLVGCATTENSTAELQEPDILQVYGTYDSGEYVNKYYGFKLTLPEDFIIHDDEMKKYVEEIGSEILKDDDDSGLNLEEIQQEQLFNILMGSKYEIGAPVSENIMIQIVSENLTFYPGVENGSDYLWHVRKLFVDGGITLVDASEFLIEEINGINFHTFSYGMNISNVTVYQKWYCVKVREHILCFALTNLTEEGFTELENIFNTIELLEQTYIN